MKLTLTLLALSLAAQERETPNTLKSTGPGPAARIDQAAWLTGRWQGEGLGGSCEEVWLPGRNGSMLGMFRLHRGGKIAFQEIMSLVEENGSLTMRLKHFHADLKGWEEKNDSVEFPLVRVEPNRLWFGGLTMERTDADTITLYLAIRMRGRAELHEEKFVYRRVRD